MLRLLDIFFVIFHTSLIIFNLFGWIWKKARIINLATLLLTGASWLFLGMLVGSPGYCPLTDWHFDILEKMGAGELPDSYVKYLADRLTGLNFNPEIVDRVTLWSYISALILSLFMNFRKKFRSS